jgi:hypothetical protein
VGEHDRLGPVAQVELSEDVPDVALHRGEGDEQLGGDLGIGPAGAHEREDITFAVALVIFGLLALISRRPRVAE